VRYRLLHAAARLGRTAGRILLHVAHTWPSADELAAAAYARLGALPLPTAWLTRPPELSTRDVGDAVHRAGGSRIPTTRSGTTAPGLYLILGRRELY
jgi:hypothetical protein